MQKLRQWITPERGVFLAAALLCALVSGKLGYNALHRAGEPPQTPRVDVPLVRVADSDLENVLRADGLQAYLAMMNIHCHYPPPPPPDGATKQIAPDRTLGFLYGGDPGSAPVQQIPDPDPEKDRARGPVPGDPPAGLFALGYCGYVKAGGRKVMLVRDEAHAVRRLRQGDRIDAYTLETITASRGVFRDEAGALHEVTDSFLRRAALRGILTPIPEAVDAEAQD